MASTGVNVLRWSALGLGVGWGFRKQASITAREKAADEKAEYDRRAKLISQAKQEWQRKNAPPSQSIAQSESKSSKKDLDGSEKDFDIETLLHLKE